MIKYKIKYTTEFVSEVLEAFVLAKSIDEALREFRKNNEDTMVLSIKQV